jgi:monoamine oxidase
LLPAEQRRQEVLRSVARFVGPRALEPAAFLERDWNAEEWTRGCYGAHLPPGAWTQVGQALREPIGRIYWAGTETAVRWCGYIDGAISSGERAAQEVLAAR